MWEGSGNSSEYVIQTWKTAALLKSSCTQTKKGRHEVDWVRGNVDVYILYRGRKIKRKPCLITRTPSAQISTLHHTVLSHHFCLLPCFCSPSISSLRVKDNSCTDVLHCTSGEAGGPVPPLPCPCSLMPGPDAGLREWLKVGQHGGIERRVS